LTAWVIDKVDCAATASSFEGGCVRSFSKSDEHRKENKRENEETHLIHINIHVDHCRRRRAFVSR
jgi:hypothetical protein